MNLIPDEELKSSGSINFAPMIDFLFIMLALFATLAITRATLLDSSIDLVRLKTDKNASISEAQEIHHVNLSINSQGTYQWITEFNEHPMDNLEKIQQELSRQYYEGLLPKNKEKTKILLHIDQNAPWNAVANLIFAIKELGFEVRPIHQVEN